LALNDLEIYKDTIKYFEKAIQLDSNNLFAFNSKEIALDKLAKYQEYHAKEVVSNQMPVAAVYPYQGYYNQSYMYNNAASNLAYKNKYQYAINELKQGYYDYKLTLTIYCLHKFKI
jgi:hypothetical protein